MNYLTGAERPTLRSGVQHRGGVKGEGEDELSSLYAMSSATSRRRAYYALAILLGFVVLGSLASAHRRILSLRGSSPHQLLGQPPATPTSYSNALQRSILSSDLSYAAPWTPLPLSRCEFGTPQHFAPCVAERVEGVVYAEEFLYPDFEIRRVSHLPRRRPSSSLTLTSSREPHFARPEHRERWREIAAGIRERGVLQDSGWLSYRGQHGQNFVSAVLPLGSNLRANLSPYNTTGLRQRDLLWRPSV